MNVSTTTAARNCSASSPRATRTVKSAWRGTPKKSSVRSTTITIPTSQSSSSSGSAAISKTRSCPIEVRSLGRTLIRWKDQIAAWHRAHVTNGPTEAANNLIKRIKRVAFGFTRFRNYRIRVLLYAGKPNWDLLATITPR